MQTPAQADSHGASPDPAPPYVPIRHVRWPTNKTPRWLIAGGLLVVIAAVLVGVAVHPSRSQRATDLNGFFADMKTGIESCALPRTRSAARRWCCRAAGRRGRCGAWPRPGPAAARRQGRRPGRRRSRCRR